MRYGLDQWQVPVDKKVRGDNKNIHPSFDQFFGCCCQLIFAFHPDGDKWLAELLTCLPHKRFFGQYSGRIILIVEHTHLLDVGKEHQIKFQLLTSINVIAGTR